MLLKAKMMDSRRQHWSAHFVVCAARIFAGYTDGGRNSSIRTERWLLWSASLFE